MITCIDFMNAQYLYKILEVIMKIVKKIICLTEDNDFLATLIFL